VDDFTILFVDPVKRVVSIQSSRVDRAQNALCRLDIGEKEFNIKTELTGLQGK